MLIVNIKELVGIEEQGRLLKRGAEMAETGRIKNAFLYIKGKKIADYGPMDSDACRKYLAENHRVYDVKGSVVPIYFYIRLSRYLLAWSCAHLIILSPNHLFVTIFSCFSYLLIHFICKQAN